MHFCPCIMHLIHHAFSIVIILKMLLTTYNVIFSLVLTYYSYIIIILVLCVIAKIINIEYLNSLKTIFSQHSAKVLYPSFDVIFTNILQTRIRNRAWVRELRHIQSYRHIRVCFQYQKYLHEFWKYVLKLCRRFFVLWSLPLICKLIFTNKMFHEFNKISWK